MLFMPSWYHAHRIGRYQTASRHIRMNPLMPYLVRAIRWKPALHGRAELAL